MPTGRRAKSFDFARSVIQMLIAMRTDGKVITESFKEGASAGKGWSWGKREKVLELLSTINSAIRQCLLCTPETLSSMHDDIKVAKRLIQAARRAASKIGGNVRRFNRIYRSLLTAVAFLERTGDLREFTRKSCNPRRRRFDYFYKSRDFEMNKCSMGDTQNRNKWRVGKLKIVIVINSSFNVSARKRQHQRRNTAKKAARFSTNMTSS